MPIKQKSIVKGAAILTIAGILTRILGFIYRIYMSGAIGAEGMGLYQLIMPVYGLSWSITCSGITTSVSKLVAAENAKREYGNMGRLLKQALLITGVLSALVSITLFLFSGEIANSFIRDGRVEPSLRLLAAAVPFMAAGSCIRGYFFGLQYQKVPALSQVLEQIVRMAVIFLLAPVFITKGLEYACLAAVMGIVAGEFLSFVYVLISYRRFKSKNEFFKRPSMNAAQSAMLLIMMSLPLTLNRIIGSLLSTFENLLIPQRLQVFGLSADEALGALGKISGMAMPLIFFPSALLTSLSIALVPAVSEAAALNDKSRVGGTVQKALIFSSVVGMFASMVFVVLPNELGELIYKQDIGGILLLLGLMCPLWYLNITLSGVLNGLGKQFYIFAISLLSSLITISFVYFAVPYYGINAFILGWFASLVVVTVLSLIKIKIVTHAGIPFLRWFIKPALAAAAAGLIVEYLLNHFLKPQLGLAWGTLAALALMGVGYFSFILILGCLKISELRKIIFFGK